MEKLSQAEIATRKIKTWPIWKKEVSKFNWQYESDEECYILDGEVLVKTDEGDYTVKVGDFSRSKLQLGNGHI